MITTNSATNIRKVNDYFLVLDVNDQVRVITKTGGPIRELGFIGTGNFNDRSYKFNPTRIPGISQKYNQQALREVFSGSIPTSRSEREQLAFYGVVRIRLDSQSKQAPLNQSLDPQRGGYIIAQVNQDGSISPGKTPRIHTTVISADAELERLANEFPGTEYVMLKAVKTARVARTVIKEFSE